MPIYEFECDTCGAIHEEFYRSIPRVVPTHLDTPCSNCGDLWSKRSHKKVLSLTEFHLLPGKVSWGGGRFSSGAPSGDTPVEIDEP
jgi:hypothetical protein